MSSYGQERANKQKKEEEEQEEEDEEEEDEDEEEEEKRKQESKKERTNMATFSLSLQSFPQVLFLVLRVGAEDQAVDGIVLAFRAV